MPKNTKQVRVSYAQAVYGKEEIAAVNRILKNPNKITPGEAAAEFEKKVAAIYGKKHGSLVNSGSSANLIAIEALNMPVGSEVITPVLTFATTVAPLVQKDLVPVFVDIEEGSYLANLDQVEAAITSKTKAMIIPSLLGNIPDLASLKKLAKKHSLYLIEDSCDTLGATFDGKPTGSYTDITTTSFYASHIITAAGSGGMICIQDDALARRAKIFAAWGRESTLFGFHEKSEDIARRFAGTIDGATYDAKFIFSEVGYNFQGTEISAAFGLEQLKRLKAFSAARRKRFKELTVFAKKFEEYFILPRQDARAVTNWLSFPLTIRPGAPFTREEITRYLEEQNIQTRPIFTGNILRQPGFRDIKHRKAVSSFPVADYVMQNGFLVGAHHGMSDAQMAYLIKTLKTFLESKIS